MKVSRLSPPVTASDAFRKSRERFLPGTAGCYVLTTFDGEVLYIGLASNLRRRIMQHLDSPQKTDTTPKGRAVMVHWLPTGDIEKVERTWLETHIRHEAVLPVLNRIHSPVSV